MHEREIADLKIRNNQNRRDIDAAMSLISELKTVVDDCSKKAAIVSNHDASISAQVKLNYDLTKALKEIEDLLRRFDKKIEQMDHNICDEKTCSNGLNTQLNTAFLRIVSIEKRLDDLPFAAQLVSINNRCNNDFSAFHVRMKEIEENLSKPTKNMVDLFISLSQKVTKCLEDSEKSFREAERCSVENKILNRKLNEVLTRTKI